MIINRGGSGTNAVYNPGTNALTQNVGTSSWINLQTNNLPTSVTTVNGVDYSMAMTFDIEFVNEESINEIIWRNSNTYAALPYIVKIDYSSDDVLYETDTVYIRDATQTDYPVLSEFENPSDYIVLQRNNGASWSDAVSMNI